MPGGAICAKGSEGMRPHNPPCIVTNRHTRLPESARRSNCMRAFVPPRVPPRARETAPQQSAARPFAFATGSKSQSMPQLCRERAHTLSLSPSLSRPSYYCRREGASRRGGEGASETAHHIARRCSAPAQRCSGSAGAACHRQQHDGAGAADRCGVRRRLVRDGAHVSRLGAQRRTRQRTRGGRRAGGRGGASDAGCGTRRPHRGN